MVFIYLAGNYTVKTQRIHDKYHAAKINSRDWTKNYSPRRASSDGPSGHVYSANSELPCLPCILVPYHDRTAGWPLLITEVLIAYKELAQAGNGCSPTVGVLSRTGSSCQTSERMQGRQSAKLGDSTTSSLFAPFSSRPSALDTASSLSRVLSTR